MFVEFLNNDFWQIPFGTILGHKIPPFDPISQFAPPLLVTLLLMVIGFVILYSSIKIGLHIHLFSHFSFQNCHFTILGVNLGMTHFDPIFLPVDQINVPSNAEKSKPKAYFVLE